MEVRPATSRRDDAGQAITRDNDPPASANAGVGGSFFGRGRGKRMQVSTKIPCLSPSLPKKYAVQDKNVSLSLYFVGLAGCFSAVEGKNACRFHRKSHIRAPHCRKITPSRTKIAPYPYSLATCRHRFGHIRPKNLTQLFSETYTFHVRF